MTASLAPPAPAELPDWLSRQGVQFVRVLWCDNANILRAKAIHVGALARHLDYGVGISAGQQAVPVTIDAVVPGSGLGPVGEVWLRPDWSTLRVLPYAPTHARVLGDMVQPGGEPWPWCSRDFLRRMIEQAAGLGLEIKAAFEPEFYLLRVGREILPADETAFAESLGMDRQRPVIDAIASALVAQNIPVEQYYPESGPGQQEISVRYTDAMGAADQHIVLRETVRAVALQHDLHASFIPKPFEAAAGSGCHLHLSLWQQGKNITSYRQDAGQGSLSAVAQSFIAGLLAHLNALMAITTPSCNSFRRLQPRCWSGAFRVWGFDNREAAVRVPSNPQPPSPTHFELKTVDGAANPYLALGSAIAAGLDGIQSKLPLSAPIAVDPGELTELERQQQGIDPLPDQLSRAIEHLQQDSVLQTALGKPLAQTYLAVRQAEWQAMKDQSLAAEVRQLIHRY
ncbi:glutamine synthetase [Romeria aff. gracilis LEGE 07310]|uniref:Glutamine synthetase n=1 Tax=Vasconcelosia minhoensis LEGE 07310 TaxID=915328 RepID=A0A8J7AW11_9CYAN|nr:glutamine synthetase family protein [Romeria gracilis]MBE9076752.1 glutamine synthetase [Romeria aff. gracilis LEGE 07310]